MANILPVNSILPDALEGDQVHQAFTAELSSTETLDSIRIINNDFPNGIVVNGASYSGVFRDVFKLSPGALKYRKGFEYGQADSFSELPPKGTADLYSYGAPSVMRDNFHCTVELIYTSSDASDPAATGTQSTITKSYTQPLQGNWSTFANRFREYVR
ncbi:gp5.1 conserved hypothetical protein [Acinetobacter phage Ac42]|uniref:gp5.1 conserved hypothetical protein n=1 Tax=Acinetobacter phage Ac42 TaxID=762660 RepID=UPI0001EBCD78|nr:gp5.1 conserved hypothetical protein [Acinetobacter phage Ac42]ADI96399.1 gp5.1 conserved hypothetical protein [Acinetobacter phage Ac42]